MMRQLLADFKFQLTTSRRGRLYFAWHGFYFPPTYFNSRPHEEVDLAKRPSTIPIIVFQLTTSRRGRRNTIKALLPPSYFNSRPREEVDGTNLQVEAGTIISTHDLTRRSTPSEITIKGSGYIFQLTTSQGGRRVLLCYFLGHFHFNSRPHKEVDRLDVTVVNYLTISTHDLTRRSTCSKCGRRVPTGISTHDLTRRSTAIYAIIEVAIFYFNSRPHKEVDPAATIDYFLWICISTHDLTRRSTKVVETSIAGETFQLTTSQGGRPVCCNTNFAHLPISTHDLTRRSTVVRGSGINLRIYFNSRPHKEVDGPALSVHLVQRVISTHDLTRRSTAIFTQKASLSKSLFVLIAYNIFILH